MNKKELLPFIRNNLDIIEDKILNGNRSNSITALYFANLAYYYFLGGNADLANRIKKSHILDRYEQEWVKDDYINNARVYTVAGLTYFYGRETLKDNIIDLDNIMILVNKLSSKLNKHRIAMSIDSGYLEVKGRARVIKKELQRFNTRRELLVWLSNNVAIACSEDGKPLEDYFYEDLGNLYCE